MNDKTLRTFLWINIAATVGLYGVMFYYIIVFKEGMEWNRELRDRVEQVERSLREVERRQTHEPPR